MYKIASSLRLESKTTKKIKVGNYVGLKSQLNYQVINLITYQHILPMKKVKLYIFNNFIAKQKTLSP